MRTFKWLAVEPWIFLIFRSFVLPFSSCPSTHMLVKEGVRFSDFEGKMERIRRNHLVFSANSKTEGTQDASTPCHNHASLPNFNARPKSCWLKSCFLCLRRTCGRELSWHRTQELSLFICYFVNPYDCHLSFSLYVCVFINQSFALSNWQQSESYFHPSLPRFMLRWSEWQAVPDFNFWMTKLGSEVICRVHWLTLIETKKEGASCLETWERQVASSNLGTEDDVNNFVYSDQNTLARWTMR